MLTPEDVARRMTDVTMLLVEIRPHLPYEELRDRTSAAIVDVDACLAQAQRDAEAVEVLLAENTHLKVIWVEMQLQRNAALDSIAAAEQEIARLREALAPFKPGGDWGKVKAWIVEGARVMGKVNEGLDAAQQITRWQVAADVALDGA